MKASFLIIGIYYCICIGAMAGVSDYVVYDQRNRYQLEVFDGIVSVKVNAYYAFTDLGLLTTVVEEKKNHKLREYGSIVGLTLREAGCGTDATYHSSPSKNGVLQMLRNTTWLLDVNIVETFKGSFETNRIFVAVKPTRAFSLSEGPQYFLTDPPPSRLVFGLVRVEDDEFKKSFRGLVRYLENDLSFLESNCFDGLEGKLSFSNDYNVVFRDFTPSPCYVAREIGVPPTTVIVKDGHAGREETGEESRLMQLVKGEGVSPKKERRRGQSRNRVKPTLIPPNSLE